MQRAMQTRGPNASAGEVGCGCSARRLGNRLRTLTALALLAVHTEAAAQTADTDAQTADADAQTADADEPSGCTGPFCRGGIGVTVMIGSASAGSRDYLILGAGVSYYVIDGLSLGLDGDVWLLEDPTVYTLTPQTRYVLYFVPVIKPYLGAFYRHYFLTGDFDDLDSIGGRVGAYIVPGAGSYVGLGAVYEKMLSCEDSAFRDCDGWYPEITIGFSL